MSATTADAETITLELPRDQHGERLDRALAFVLKGRGAFSRAALQRWIREGRVELEGQPCTEPNTTVRAGAKVLVRPAPAPATDALPEDLPLTVLHVDDDVIVVDKAAGMVVHPAAGHDSGTLVNALLFRFGQLASGGRGQDPTGEEDDEAPALRRPGIVHRLDRWTSGVMVVARTDRARESLMAQLAVHSVEREYIAVVEGLAPQSARYETLHARHPSDRKRFTGRATRGKRAVTEIERAEVLHGASVVRCRLETGRTHQIRVHLSEAGFPLLADAVYGRTARDARVREASAALGRQALHARVLGFEHPTRGVMVRFESPLPSDLAGCVTALRP